MIRVGVFGDLHGNLRLMYQLVDRFEQKNGPLDAIFQVGDFGIWPDKNRIDSATMKKIKEGKEKLGFLELQKGILKPSTVTPCYFVVGNHDDYEYLDSLYSGTSQKIIPLLDNRLYHLRNGGVLKIESSDESENLVICGLGGIRKGLRPKQERKQPRIVYTQKELSDCLDLQDIDIFLTHDPPNETFSEDQDLDSLVRLINPKYHFFGHTHKYTPEKTIADKCTKMIGLANVGKDSFGQPNTGSFIVLQKEGNSLVARLPTDSHFNYTSIQPKKCKASKYEIHVETSQDITERLVYAFQENIRYICDPEGPFIGLRNMIELTKRYIHSNNFNSESDKKWMDAYEFFIVTCKNYLIQAKEKKRDSNETKNMRNSYLKDSCSTINAMCDLVGIKKISSSKLLLEAHEQAKRKSFEILLK